MVRPCNKCSKSKPRDCYSKTQWKKETRVCKDCMNGDSSSPRPSGPTKTPTPAVATADVTLPTPATQATKQQREELSVHVPSRSPTPSHFVDIQGAVATIEKTDFASMSTAEIFKALKEADREVPLAVPVIKTLTEIIKRSKADGYHGLAEEFHAARSELMKVSHLHYEIASACELFLNSSRSAASAIDPDDPPLKKVMIANGEAFKEIAHNARVKITKLSLQFLTDGAVILVHCLSRCVRDCLLHAASVGKRFTVYVTEGRPTGEGHLMAESLQAADIPTTLIHDTAMGWVMEKADLVLVGAVAVVESGGVINKAGTYQMAIVARAHNTPFYIAAESFKFAREYLLTQDDLPPPESFLWEEQRDTCSPRLPKAEMSVDFTVVKTRITRMADGRSSVGKVPVQTVGWDYTPPQFITLLFTDLGVLTPSAVSDELIYMHGL